MQSRSRDEDTARILDSLRRIVRFLRATSHAVERKLEISGAQLFVLRELGAEPGISIRRLSERTLTDPSSVSVVVARLVERGLIAREKDPVDARRSVLTLTARGERLLRRAPEPFQVRLVRALQSLPRPSQRRLSADLSLVVERAGASGGAASMFFEGPKKRGRSGHPSKSKA
ncbi:MAG: MarR family transcriptional regulator [Polyangiaceae bacterium]